ncbi:hypothetical protein NG754_06295 [Aliarcobacter cryaerophilus]|jgi:hypothetical protein|uniref:hypothetical protein n=1 Tax=Aliarcobacter cryaerophilus TaxID=28198 RepID=UPI001B77D542|nr:hypothetical protein [Aliarcobacter cryaerophilus]MBP9616471.1 hypothetical protein [Aliarcobacter sp.]MCT7507755.1 hypothetical protein [Aliarcobacter cryaerophilus]
MPKEIKYTAYIDVLGFSNHIENKITNDKEAQSFAQELINNVVNYLEYEKINFLNKYNLPDELNAIQYDYTWISDTFVITINYNGNCTNKHLSGVLISLLSLTISQVYHFFARKYGLLLRGAITSKYTFLGKNLILGKGIAEAAKLEKEIAIYPRVIFAEDVISDDIISYIVLMHNDNNLNIVSKDFDGWYFVNYIASLQDLPPMIGEAKKSMNEIDLNEMAKLDKIETIKSYSQIIDNGLKEKNLKIRSKYLWLKEYFNKVLPTDGKTYNMFAYNILGDPQKADGENK